MATRLWTLHIVLALCFSIIETSAATAEQRLSASEAIVERPANLRVIAGYIEWARLERHSFDIRAKLDTGAKSSSINAIDMMTFVRNGKSWVRFSVMNKLGRTMLIERPIIRTAKIHRAGTAVSERPVIKLHVCVAGEASEAEVTLANRTGMNYALLIGRSFMRNRILVDSAATYLGDGKCGTENK
jgi:hypothetical protein